MCQTCETTATDATATETPVGVVTSYTVEGMTCGGCANTVDQHVTGVPGVLSVAVDVATGQVTVTTDGPADDAAISAAVTEAGYRVAA
ncbi:heavy-metal-associated domain-containing protein [Stackebrandtia soli]|uniref:heavy-metal-associated domain-containing protein n=1 Tax=Stackebrandtia soli TaxID=1892856 RepID=UPI0039E7D3DE